MRATTTDGPAPHYHTLRPYSTWTDALPNIAGGHFHRPGDRSDGRPPGWSGPALWLVTGPAYYGNGDLLPEAFQHTHHHTEVTE